MAVIGVLTEPTPPSWWQANRHKVYLVTGLICGYLIGSHTQPVPDPQQHPHPGHTTPAPTTPSTHTALRPTA
ncbi:hypothetical protein [Streptomyces sp. CC53]|uniref:hypothetical protein n=1 Tax=Streptomyces sp. CC53 TaxID=1906740 RepID=UPI00115F99D7|nr:hypothetical protein [Streptomyces sp. CC53]